MQHNKFIIYISKNNTKSLIIKIKENGLAAFKISNSIIESYDADRIAEEIRDRYKSRNNNPEKNDKKFHQDYITL